MGNDQTREDDFFMTMLANTPLRKLVEFSNGIFSEECIEKIIELVNSDQSMDGITLKNWLIVPRRKRVFLKVCSAVMRKNIFASTPKSGIWLRMRMS